MEIITTTEPYNSPTIFSIKKEVVHPIRLGIQGPSGSGKSWSALTFPNPLVLNFDNCLEAFATRADIKEVPFYDAEWVNKQLPAAVGKPPRRKDLLLKWLSTEGIKIPPGNTVIIDSWTTLQAAFDEYKNAHPTINTKGDEDGFAFWGAKKDFSQEVYGYIRAMKCNVVVLFHELQTRDPATGQLLTKIQPLMQGSFVNELKIPFPNFFRMLDIEKMKDGKEVGCEYFWQVKSDKNFSAKTSLDIPNNVFQVKADYSIFEQYRRKA